MEISPVFNTVKEFHMGLFFHSSSWRKPLQLIECWLPEPKAPGLRAAPVAAPDRALRRFSRAGWLGRSAANQAALARRRHDGRVALAGRIDEVCRELDRLVADEASGGLRAMKRRA